MAQVFVPCPNTAKVVMHFTYDGQDIQNVYHVEKGVPWTVSEQTALAAEFAAWFDESVQQAVSSEYQLTEILVNDLTTQSSPGITYTGTLPISGAASGDPEPASVSVVCSWHTSLRGKSYRGRSYWAGLTDVQINKNTITGSVVDVWQGAADALSGIGMFAQGVLVVASRFTAGAPRTTGVMTPIESGSVSPKVRTQRRRLPA